MAKLFFNYAHRQFKTNLHLKTIFQIFKQRRQAKNAYRRYYTPKNNKTNY